MTIHLNADLGEGFGRRALTDDEGLLDVVTSANVACGSHAGDTRTMQPVVALCAQRGVVVGAQVSYRDLAGFGRRFIDVDPAELTAEVVRDRSPPVRPRRLPQRRRGRPRRAVRSVLVTLDPRVTTTTAVVAALRSAAGTPGRPTGSATSRAHEISVVEVAFAGFAYLAGARSRARSCR
ncbi:LamB/YcsF family protein [Janibacter sp. YAF2_2]|uniref:LamB/YcsF family protein n=1 Tax=unclassified Janibacter TaxID=2649294 RepID=UPI003F8E3239